MEGMQWKGEGRKQIKRPLKTSSAKREKNVHFLFSILKAAIDTTDYFMLAWLFLPPFHRLGNSRKEM